ncbi:MAG: hypothetical protein ACYCWW_14890, partial [Deltaproteobacteria bacterium]
MRAPFVALAAMVLTVPAVGNSTESTKSGASSSSAGGSETSSMSPGISDVADRDSENGPLSSKRWQVEAGYELHGLLVQNTLVGNGPDTVFEYFSASARYDLTP